MIKELKISRSITPRDSRALAQYFVDINSTRPLSPEDEVDLAVRIQQGDMAARDQLVQANLRFVVSVAKQYQNSGIALEDLINEGNIGLIRAAERYDPTRGFKFDTFAVWWIRQAITSALADVSRTVRMPLNVINQINKVRKAITAFEQEHERVPSDEELSFIVDMPVERIHEIMDQYPRTTSLDAPMADDSDTTVGEMLPSTVEATDAALMKESTRYDVGKMIGMLPAREGTILRMCFGLDGEERSLEEIADMLHITRERVRQLKEKALRSLRVNYSDILIKHA